MQSQPPARQPPRLSSHRSHRWPRNRLHSAITFGKPASRSGCTPATRHAGEIGEVRIVFDIVSHSLYPTLEIAFAETDRGPASAGACGMLLRTPDISLRAAEVGGIAGIGQSLR